ncbi:hypothetical protein PWG71_11470 [Nocardiopsis sp. N85]|uniref:hypothetical protein n=1 Tax=Nocardiopsis sp. N85 TaxID=3029400 RepID=UPI00237FBA2D|nr:hypothetical protein [Nocardiopsis sp. N85]MDE3722010.1 hypothetical protein [Nocardiopsis sp. N85]
MNTRTSPVPPPVAAVRPAPTTWAVLAWSALALALGLGWISGLLPSGVPEGDGFGSLFGTWGSTAAAWLTLALGLVGTVCAVVMTRPGRGGPAVAYTAWGLSAATVVFFITGSLLALFGYTMIMPVAAWFVPGLVGLWMEQVLKPETLTLLFFTVGAALWAVAGLAARRAAGAACPDCGRAHDWTPQVERTVRARALKVGRVAVLIACLSSLAYPALRFPWLLGITPGMGADFSEEFAATPGTLFVGVGLGAAGAAGTLLMTGLVLRWGVRFPFWTVGLRGRRVPIALAVVPATLVALALIAMGRSVLVQIVMGQAGMLTASDPHAWVFLGMAVWGVALAVATVAYAVRRRAECDTCERGLPEVDPRGLRAAA